LIGSALAILIITLAAVLPAPASLPAVATAAGPASLAQAAEPEACLPEEAEQPQARTLSARDARRAQLHFCIGRSAMFARRYHQAIIQFRAATVLDSTSAILYRYLGISQFAVGDIRGAKQSLRRAVNLKPDEAPSLYRLGRIAHTEDRKDEAIGFFKRLAGLGRPAGHYYLLAHYYLAEIYRSDGDVDSAIRYYEDFLGLMSDKGGYANDSSSGAEVRLMFRAKPRFTFTLARLYLLRGNNDGAIKLFSSILAGNPKNAKARALLVRANIQSLKFDRALVETRRFIESHPDLSKGYKLLAEVLRAQGKPADIIPSLEAYQKRWPAGRALALHLARAYEADGRLGDAKEAYLKLLKGGGDPLPVCLRLAGLFHAEGKPVEALSVYAGGFATGGSQSKLLVAATRYVGRLKEPAEVLKQAQRLVGDDEKSAAPFLVIAILAEQADKSDEAIDLYGKAISRDPTLSVAYARRASLLVKKGKTEEALKTYQDAAKQGIKIGIFFRNAGVLSEQLKRDKEALDLYRKAVETVPDDKISRHLLSALCLKLELYEEAQRELRVIISRWPDDIRAYSTLAAVYERMTKYDQAEFQINRALAIQPDNPSLQLMLAELYIKGNKLEKAREKTAGILRKNPNNTDARYVLAHIFSAKRDYKRAVRELKTLIKARPDNPVYRYFLSGLYNTMGDMKKSEAELAALLKLKPDFPPANNDLGYLWAERGENLERAEQMIRRAVKAEPDNAAYLDSLGWVMYKRGRFAEAAKLLGRAAKVAPNLDPVIWDHLGDTRFRLDDAKGAIEAWRKAVDVLEGEKRSPRRGDTLKRIQDKLKRIESGKKPAVAPRASRANPGLLPAVRMAFFEENLLQ
ncbi:MAG: tetratricopeptide repeat protein, partial [Phycisphaerae bacterium]|nr:tetratricopeptide repeat protein [Phycisphaerae bacterium]